MKKVINRLPFFVFLVLSQLACTDEPVFINTLPKSGSVVIVNTLVEGLKRPFCRISYATFPEDQIIEDDLKAFACSNSITQGHINASPENIALLKKYRVKMILHVRDPRQAVLSWAHHLILGKEHILTYSPHAVPRGFYNWTFEQQLDHQLKVYYPQVIQWITDWLKVYQEGGVNMKVLTYENDFHYQEELYFEKVLDFFNVPLSSFTLYHFPKNMRWNFRKGDPNEWREVFTPRQVDQVNALLSDELCTFFNWQR